MNVKKNRNCKKNKSWNPSICICENSKYLKCVADTSLISCDEIVSVVNIVSTKNANTMALNIKNNCHSKKERCTFDCYILHTVLLATISLLKIIIISSCYAKHWSKQKDFDALTI